MKNYAPALLGSILVGLSACGVGLGASADVPATSGATTSVAQPPAFELSDLPVEGGCASVVYAASQDWTQVVEIRVGDPERIAAGEPTKFEIGQGVTARLVTGENMANLFCNDVIEGDERTDGIFNATSGTVTVFLDEPYSDNSGGVVTQVTATDLVFQTDPPTTVAWLDITASIGWYAG